MVTEVCVAMLVKRPNISSNDIVALCEFADKCRYVLETLVSLNAANEMNTFHLSSLVKKLPIPLTVQVAGEGSTSERFWS
jgi:hypothetical protein